MGTIHKTTCVLCAQNAVCSWSIDLFWKKEDILSLKERNHVKVI